MSQNLAAAKLAADHHTTLNVFAAVVALMEASLIYDPDAQRTANKITKLCFDEQQRQLRRMDAALEKVK